VFERCFDDKIFGKAMKNQDDDEKTVSLNH
jgi:hypothetical protein